MLGNGDGGADAAALPFCRLRDRPKVVIGARLATGTANMHPKQSRDDLLKAMLQDILSEAELVRPHDPVRAAKLEEAANDLRSVIAEETVEGDVDI
jgi:hypothetical protein